MTSGHVQLPDGAVLRPAGPQDLDALGALLTERGESADAVDLELVVNDPDAGWSGVGVVEHGGVVVATATLLDEAIRVGNAAIPAGQIELVACAESHEHRGYVRALMRWCHAESYIRGHRAQVMIGIPYFYRRFGYHYAIPMHPYAPLRKDLAPVDDIVVRPTIDSDIPDMAALQSAIQERFDVSVPHQAACWRWLVERDGSTNYVAERNGTVVATGRWTPPEEDSVLVSEVAALEADATRALLSSLSAEPTLDVRVQDRPHVLGLSELLGERTRPDWYYMRIEEPGLVFSAVRDELTRRLSESSFATADQLVELSFWESQLAFPIANGRVGPITTGGPRQVIVSQGGSGLPPDAIAHLVFGCGARGLEDRFPDCYLGDQAELMDVLFPPQQADLLTFYLPG